MTAAQTALYFREWGRAREYYKNKGITGTALDGKRHELHVRALGRDKSSKSFNNRDLDKVLGVFRAVWDDGNLNAQLRQIEQPEERREDMQNRAWDACVAFIKNNDSGVVQRYIDGLSRKVCGADFAQLSEPQLGKIMGILERRVKTKAATAKSSAPVSGASGENDDQPF